MMVKVDFKKAFGDAMKVVGFARKGQSWFKNGGDSTVVLNLQKSDFDDKYYVNFGVWLKALGDVAFPSENKCHIQARLTSLFPEHSEMIDRACKLASGANEVAELMAFLTEEFAPFCDDCLRIDGLQARFSNGKFKKALIMKPARDLLTVV
jgi:hypothetical protein